MFPEMPCLLPPPKKPNISLGKFRPKLPKRKEGLRHLPKPPAFYSPSSEVGLDGLKPFPDWQVSLSKVERSRFASDWCESS